jgi:hypothetical protein
MSTHHYSNDVDGITFTGTYVVEADDFEYVPIISLSTLEVQGIDLMLVIDPRVVHEIEKVLLEDLLWNADCV